MYTTNELVSVCYVVASLVGATVVPTACNSKGVCLRALEAATAYTIPSAPQFAALSLAGRIMLPIALSSTATVAVLMARPTTFVAPINGPAAIVFSQLVTTVAVIVGGLTISSHISIVDPVAGTVYNTTPLFVVLALSGAAAAIVWVHLARYNNKRVNHNNKIDHKSA